MKTLYLNYERCLVNLSNSILKYFEVDCYHNSLEEIDNIPETLIRETSIEPSATTFL